MNIIVTGGAGFIGSNFIFHMLKKYPDYRIICLDCLTYAGNLSTLAPVMDNPNFRFVKENITDRAAVYKLFEEEHPDMVVNFAAESHVDRSIENPEIFLDTNIKGTAVLMDACRKYGITRYHQVSTDEVYGDLPLDRPDLFFTEETPIHTSSPYSSSKAGADLLVLAYHRTYGLPVTISRCSNNYGPYHFPEKLIPLMIANALNDKPLPVYGKGENEVRALDGVSFSVEKGEFVAVIGPSGSGKSTLLHILGGVDRPTGGKVFMDGKDVYAQNEEQLAIFRRRQVGLIYQFYNLIPVLNVTENITLPVLMDGQKVNQNRLAELMTTLKLTGRENHLPNQLSGGQQQRVSIGRALMNAPAVVLADEPTGNLDSKSSREIVELLKVSNEKYGQTLLVITHDESIALQADRILSIEDGKITRDEVIRR